MTPVCDEVGLFWCDIAASLRNILEYIKVTYQAVNREWVSCIFHVYSAIIIFAKLVIRYSHFIGFHSFNLNPWTLGSPVSY